MKRLRNTSNVLIKKEFLINNWVTNLSKDVWLRWGLLKNLKEFHFQREVFRDAQGIATHRRWNCKRCSKKTISCVSSNDTWMVRATLRVYLVKESAIYGHRRRRRSSDLLSSLSQLVTLPFQSQVCLSTSKANPLGHVICFRPDLVHLAEPGQKTEGAGVSLTWEKTVMFAHSQADRSSSRSSSSRKSAARCRRRDPWDTVPSPVLSRRSRWPCRT